MFQRSWLLMGQDCCFFLVSLVLLLASHKVKALWVRSKTGEVHYFWKKLIIDLEQQKWKVWSRNSSRETGSSIKSISECEILLFFHCFHLFTILFSVCYPSFPYIRYLLYLIVNRLNPTPYVSWHSMRMSVWVMGYSTCQINVLYFTMCVCLGVG